ncbi:MAG: heme-binding domain-containing protein [Flavipsychrobacter sp.]|nr:heme-binding domain-containing protein [Flavipsychrobacter sp.]
MIKKILLALLIVFVIIQFIRPKHNTSDITPDDITHVYAVPDSVHEILAKACLDCHSNNTRYPWYNNMAPVSWFLNSHVQDAKKELNFSEFATFPKKRQAKKLAKVAKSVDEGWMPIDSYMWIHKDAILTPREKELVSTWAKSLSKQIADSFHIDMTEKTKKG